MTRRCGIEEVAAVMRQSRLRWFGHVVRWNGAGLLVEVMELNVPGVRPRGKTRKQWKDNLKDDMRALNLREESAHDEVFGEMLSKRQTLHGQEDDKRIK